MEPSQIDMQKYYNNLAFQYMRLEYYVVKKILANEPLLEKIELF